MVMKKNEFDLSKNCLFIFETFVANTTIYRVILIHLVFTEDFEYHNDNEKIIFRLDLFI